MNKKAALIVLLVFCILAIYNLKTSSSEPQAVPTKVGPQTVKTEAPVIQKPARVIASQPITPSSALTLKKISTLKEILTLKNDNDPRMDTELKNLTDQDKDALVGLYQSMKPESLNGKGTIAFLIGREMTRPEDAEFLKNILSEEPCLSLENCGLTNAQRDPHMGAVNEVTLNYPQIVALNRIKNYAQTHDLEATNPAILAHLTDAVKIGQNSKIPLVQTRSKEIADLLTRDLTKAKK